MSSPLTPLLVNIFLIHLEKSVTDELKDNGVVCRRRYVDDIFAVIHDIADVTKLRHILNQFHPAIQFTQEDEEEYTISFLDINIARIANDKKHQQLSMTIYRKPTYTGLITKWSSFAPQHFKKNAMSTVIYHAIQICSSYALLNDEFMFMKQVATTNGYLMNYIERQICQTFNQCRKIKKTKPTQQPTPDILHTNNSQPSKTENEKTKKQVLLVDIPYVEKPTKKLGKQLIKIASRIKL